MSATSTSWKRKPFVAGVALPYTAAFNAEEFSRLKDGLVPQQMEDKWFVYFEEPYLYFHRSWLGEGVYRVQLEPSDDGARVVEASWDEDLMSRRPGAAEYEAQLLDFLLSNLLLGQSKPFPRPQGVAEPAPGVLQHHVAGTAYREVTHGEGASGKASASGKSVKPWWRFW